MVTRTEPVPRIDPTRFQLMDIGWVDEETDTAAPLPRDIEPDVVPLTESADDLAA